MSDLNKVRSDNKRSNAKKDANLVSTIKSLYERGVPASIIASLYNVAVSTVVMWGTNHRQSQVEPCSTHKATADITARFNEMINNTKAV